MPEEYEPAQHYPRYWVKPYVEDPRWIAYECEQAITFDVVWPDDDTKRQILYTTWADLDNEAELAYAKRPRKRPDNKDKKHLDRWLANHPTAHPPPT